MNNAVLNFKNGVLIFFTVLLLSFSTPYVYAQWIDVTPPNVSSNWKLFGIQFISANEGWAVGRDSLNNTGVLLHFLNVAIGALKDQTVTVGNNGNGHLIIGTITSPSAPFSLKTDNCSGKTIASQSSCKLVYRFDPTSGGTFTSSSNIPSNDPSR